MAVSKHKVIVSKISYFNTRQVFNFYANYINDGFKLLKIRSTLLLSEVPIDNPCCNQNNKPNHSQNIFFDFSIFHF